MVRESMEQTVRQLLRPIPLIPKFAEIKAFKASIEALAEGHDELAQRVVELEKQLAESRE